MSVIKLGCLALSIISFSVGAAEGQRIFFPAPGAKAVVEVDGGVTWKVNFGGRINSGKLDIDTEKPIYVDINDYDFSGHLGFAVWHVDDGMGTYSSYRVFTFSLSKNKFVERNPAPLCGGEFVNLRVDKKRHLLLSTFWSRNVPKLCITRLSPLK